MNSLKKTNLNEFNKYPSLAGHQGAAYLKCKSHQIIPKLFLLKFTYLIF